MTIQEAPTPPGLLIFGGSFKLLTASKQSQNEWWRAQKRGAGDKAPARALAACGLGGRGIGRYHLLMSAGKAACRAV